MFKSAPVLVARLLVIDVLLSKLAWLVRVNHFALRVLVSLPFYLFDSTVWDLLSSLFSGAGVLIFRR